jgi:hypothetical protein
MTAEKNGLRMKNEKTLKENRFSFFAHPQKRKADPHLAHCLLPNTQASASQKSKSQISQPTFRISEFEI